MISRTTYKCQEFQLQQNQHNIATLQYTPNALQVSPNLQEKFIHCSKLNKARPVLRLAPEPKPIDQNPAAPPLYPLQTTARKKESEKGGEKKSEQQLSKFVFKIHLKLNQQLKKPSTDLQHQGVK